MQSLLAFCVFISLQVASAQKTALKWPLLWQPCVQVFQAHLSIKYVSNFSHQPQKCSLYFNIFVSKCMSQSGSHIQEKSQSILLLCSLQLYFKYFSTAHVTNAHWLVLTHTPGMAGYSS